MPSGTLERMAAESGYQAVTLIQEGDGEDRDWDRKDRDTSHKRIQTCVGVRVSGLTDRLEVWAGHGRRWSQGHVPEWPWR